MGLRSILLQQGELGVGRSQHQQRGRLGRCQPLFTASVKKNSETNTNYTGHEITNTNCRLMMYKPPVVSILLAQH